MLISVREAYKYAREHIEGDRLAPLSRFGVEDFGEDREKTPVCYGRSARTSFNASLLLSKGFRDAYGLGGCLIAWKAAGLPTRYKRDASGKGGGKRFASGASHEFHFSPKPFTIYGESSGNLYAGNVGGNTIDGGGGSNTIYGDAYGLYGTVQAIPNTIWADAPSANDSSAVNTMSGSASAAAAHS
jgi:rhodanese-related sulfurtransferase